MLLLAGGLALKALMPLASVVYSVSGHLDTSISELKGRTDAAMQLITVHKTQFRGREEKDGKYSMRMQKLNQVTVNR